MAEITAAAVRELREISGQGMMDCKAALQQTGGDIQKALDLLRKKGMAVMEKRGGRETKEGRIVGKVSPDGKRAVVTMLASETDFVAKSPDFQRAAELVAEALMGAAAIPASSEELAGLAAGGKKVADAVNEVVSKTGEKIHLGSFARFDLAGSGLLFCYVHFNGKIGTLLQIETDSEAVAKNPAVRTLASDLAMHVTAVNPVSVSRTEVPADQIEREREVANAQVQNKPPQMVAKIVEGKLNKWFQSIVLLEQPFVKDDSKTVQQVIDETAKAAGGKITFKRFARLQIG